MSARLHFGCKRRSSRARSRLGLVRTPAGRPWANLIPNLSAQRPIVADVTGCSGNSAARTSTTSVAFLVSRSAIARALSRIGNCLGTARPRAGDRVAHRWDFRATKGRHAPESAPTRLPLLDSAADAVVAMLRPPAPHHRRRRICPQQHTPHLGGRNLPRTAPPRKWGSRRSATARGAPLRSACALSAETPTAREKMLTLKGRWARAWWLSHLRPRGNSLRGLLCFWGA